ncbi:MarR family transcriptional regulator [Oleiagrimonas sp.]|jgi:MarR family transcriptional regulator for hemolysin|uniref:MarR family winged helix-turn-helix transcriptional regulator n=1 Tax=Oleiagrimonas sp. TaxID=2010330 RepID=UPI0026366E6C|nr:MarR family transcriptional regulator [Oleiagrimonas sp.]MDA3914717.1 MarR family transcriptional regulator [Oleiagrimonas sp.]
MTRLPDMSFGYLLNDVTLLFRKHFDRRATRFGLTRAQWRALKCLHLRQGIRQSELAEYLEMEAIAVGRVIDRLQAAGFVERRADPSDRRCWRLYPTPQAQAVNEDMEDIARGLRVDATRDISVKDLQHMINVLTRIKENLQALENHVDSEDASEHPEER